MVYGLLLWLLLFSPRQSARTLTLPWADQGKVHSALATFASEVEKTREKI